jgi:hypothetical protein
MRTPYSAVLGRQSITRKIQHTTLSFPTQNILFNKYPPKPNMSPRSKADNEVQEVELTALNNGVGTEVPSTSIPGGFFITADMWEHVNCMVDRVFRMQTS